MRSTTNGSVGFHPLPTLLLAMDVNSRHLLDKQERFVKNVSRRDPIGSPHVTNARPYIERGLVFGVSSSPLDHHATAPGARGKRQALLFEGTPGELVLDRGRVVLARGDKAAALPLLPTTSPPSIPSPSYSATPRATFAATTPAPNPLCRC